MIGEDPKYQEQENAETKRCRGIVLQKEAELEQAKAAHIEARKAQWSRIPMTRLLPLAKIVGVFYCLYEQQWREGLFEFRARVESGDSNVSIGGFWYKSDFKGEEYVMVPTALSNIHFPA